MKIVGLIAEYNPFHNGHLYHLKKSLEITGADAAVVVMSGDYVQRGTPAILPKRIRAKMALASGAAAVFELPVCYATGSAELFAHGAVTLLDRLGAADYLCFGSECSDLPALKRLAEVLADEPEGYKKILRNGLRQGLAFPAARQRALSSIAGEVGAALLLNPNNTLGVEYLKAIRRTGSSLLPFTIQRQGSGYHDVSLGTGFSSASAIRQALTSDLSPSSSDALRGRLPSDCEKLLRSSLSVWGPVEEDDLSLLLKYRLLRETKESLSRYLDISEDLANRILSLSDDFSHLSQFAGLLKTKEITRTRINRGLLHILLQITKDQVREYAGGGFHYYAHLLGFRKDREDVVSEISRRSKVPLLTSLHKTESLAPLGKEMLQSDIFASNLYRSVITEKFGTAYQNEYRQGVLKH